MDIIINDEKLDYQLESEKNLKDVIESLNDWLFNNLKVIDTIAIDGKVHTDDIQSLNKYTIDDVKKLELTIVDIHELIKNSLLETKKYLKETHKYINSKEDYTEADIKRIVSGLNWLENIFTRINNIYNYEKKFESENFNFKNEFSHFIKLKNKIEKHYSIKEFNEVSTIIKNELIICINNWYNNIDKLIENDSTSIKNLNTIREKVSEQVFKIIKKIPDMQKLIEMASMDIQTGHEKEAMTNLQIILGTLESITALLQLIKSTFSLDYNNIKYNDESVEKTNKALTNLLKELLQAMEIKDTVLMSDLLTYELMPRLENYSDILKIIAKEIDIEIN